MATLMPSSSAESATSTLEDSAASSSSSADSSAADLAQSPFESFDAVTFSIVGGLVALAVVGALLAALILRRRRRTNQDLEQQTSARKESFMRRIGSARRPTSDTWRATVVEPFQFPSKSPAVRFQDPHMPASPPSPDLLRQSALSKRSSCVAPSDSISNVVDRADQLDASLLRANSTNLSRQGTNPFGARVDQLEPKWLEADLQRANSKATQKDV